MCVFHIIDPCVISHNSALQKLLSLISIVCQTCGRQSDMLSFVIVNFLWHPACTHFYVIQLLFGIAVNTTQQNVQLSDSVS